MTRYKLFKFREFFRITFLFWETQWKTQNYVQLCGNENAHESNQRPLGYYWHISTTYFTYYIILLKGLLSYFIGVAGRYNYCFPTMPTCILLYVPQKLNIKVEASKSYPTRISWKLRYLCKIYLARGTHPSTLRESQGLLETLVFWEKVIWNTLIVGRISLNRIENHGWW